MAEHAPHEHVAAGDPPHPATHHQEAATHAATPGAFTDAEIADLHANDLAAARAVVMLMLGIFSTGVGIYSIVAFWVINFS